MNDNVKGAMMSPTASAGELEELIYALEEQNSRLYTCKSRLVDKVGKIVGYEPQDCEAEATKEQSIDSALEKIRRILYRYDSELNDISNELNRLDRVI